MAKSRLLTSEHSRTLSITTLYLISPSVMIRASQIGNTPEILDGLELSVALAVAFRILLITLGRLFKTLSKLDALGRAVTAYTNSGNLIIPLIMSIFGPQWVIYTSSFIIVQTLLFWTRLRLLLCGNGKLSWKTVLINISILSILFGILLSACQIRLPRIIDNTLATIGGVIGPVTMLVAGMLIASLPLKGIIPLERVYLTAFLRLILIPLILLLFVKISGIAHPDRRSDTIALIGFPAAVSPTASTVTQVAVVYDQNVRKTSAIYGIITLFYIVAIPLMIGLYRLAI